MLALGIEMVSEVGEGKGHVFVTFTRFSLKRDPRRKRELESTLRLSGDRRSPNMATISPLQLISCKRVSEGFPKPSTERFSMSLALRADVVEKPAPEIVRVFFFLLMLKYS